MLKQYIEEKAHRAIVCLTLGNICTGKPNSFCFILTDEALMNKLIVYAINSEWKIKQYALTGKRIFTVFQICQSDLFSTLFTFKE